MEVTEVDQSKACRLGFRWTDPTTLAEKGLMPVLQLGPFQRTPLSAELSYLVEKGAAELLANPNLITDSGTVATFHAGGEIPYMTTSSLGATNVEFKSYGVLLQVKPDVLKSGLIEMNVKAIVSSPDQTNGVVVSGNSVPAILEREVTSHVTVTPETTMTLAGLMQTLKEESEQGVPLLRKIPILGALFRWKHTATRRTSIIIFVTPKVVTL